MERMISHRTALLRSILLTFFLTGCSQQFLTRQDYEPSVTALKVDNPELAIEKFPEKEDGGFITTMEKTYLSLLAGKAELDGLLKYAKQIQNRVRYDVSREIAAFFYVETPDGYYASEHEIVWMHLLLSWGFSLQGKYEDACVEARESSLLLSAPWSDEGHFDDAMLRTVLAVMWQMCGNWEEARVDLRRVYYLNPDLVWAKELAERDQPPRNLFLGFAGAGAQPYWDPALDINPVAGLKHLGFKLVADGSNIRLAGNKNFAFYQSPDASYWYKRHWIRDNAIHELIDDSKYGSSVLVGSGAEAAKLTAAVTYSVTAGVLLTSAGLAILKYANDANAFEVGLGLTIFGPVYATNNIKYASQDANEGFKDQFDTSDRYRYVRFLPDFVWFGWTDDELAYPVTIIKDEKTLMKLSPVIAGATNVSVFHHADTPVNPDRAALILAGDKSDIWLKQLKREMNASALRNMVTDFYRTVSASWPSLGESRIRDKIFSAEGFYYHNYFRLTLKNNKLYLEIRRSIFEANEVLIFDVHSDEITVRVSSDKVLYGYLPEHVVAIMQDLLKNADTRLK